MKSKIALKLVLLIVTTFFLFSSLLFVYINHINHSFVTKLEENEKFYIEKFTQEENKYLIQNNILLLETYIKPSIKALSTALYNLDDAIIRDIASSLLKLDSITGLFLYDTITQKPHLYATKINNKIVFTNNVKTNSDLNSKFFKYNLTLNKIDVGYLKIYYSTDSLLKDSQDLTQRTILQFTTRFREIRDNLSDMYNNTIINFIILSIISLIVIFMFIIKLVNKPLTQFQQNLFSFFKVIDNSTYDYKPVKIKTNDEFEFMADELNTNIYKTLSLHKQISNFVETIDKNVITCQYDKDENLLSVSSAFSKISGYSKDELLQLKYSQLFYEIDSDNIIRELNNNTIVKQSRYKKKNGDIYWLNRIITSSYVNNSIQYTEIMDDITSKKEVIALKDEIELTQKEIIFTIGSIAEERSHETGLHVKRVAEYSAILAKHAGLTEEEIVLLKNASPMHDIGKIAIPDNILNKPGKLDKNEFEIMKTHAQLGYDMLKYSTRPLLHTAAIVAHTHHEKYDGSGYPDGIKGEDIHIYGRITAIADVFDALSAHRCYKAAWSDEKIFDLFRKERGKHFDPKLIDTFFEHLDEFLEVRKKFIDDIK